MKFTEDSLERAVIELFGEISIEHVQGQEIHRESEDVILVDDLERYLISRYSRNGIAATELKQVINRVTSLPNKPIYESNRAFMGILSEGFILNRDDRSQKDFVVKLLDSENIERNIFKVVNQLEVKGSEKRIPDAIVYINGLPLVVIEFKSAIKENTTILDAHTTTRYYPRT